MNNDIPTGEGRSPAHAYSPDACGPQSTGVYAAPGNRSGGFSAFDAAMEKFVVTNLFKAVPDPQRTRIEQALRHDMLAEPQRARMKPRDPPGNGAKGVIRYLKRGRAFVDWLDERAGEATIEDITKQFGCSRASAYRWLAAVRGSEA